MIEPQKTDNGTPPTKPSDLSTNDDDNDMIIISSSQASDNVKGKTNLEDIIKDSFAIPASKVSLSQRTENLSFQGINIGEETNKNLEVSSSPLFSGSPSSFAPKNTSIFDKDPKTTSKYAEFNFDISTDSSDIFVRNSQSQNHSKVRKPGSISDIDLSSPTKKNPSNVSFAGNQLPPSSPPLGLDKDERSDFFFSSQPTDNDETQQNTPVVLIDDEDEESDNDIDIVSVVESTNSTVPGKSSKPYINSKTTTSFSMLSGTYQSISRTNTSISTGVSTLPSSANAPQSNRQSAFDFLQSSSDDELDFSRLITTMTNTANKYRNINSSTSSKTTESTNKRTFGAERASTTVGVSNSMPWSTSEIGSESTVIGGTAPKQRMAGRNTQSTTDADKIIRAAEREMKKREKEQEKVQKAAERETKRQKKEQQKELNLMNQKKRMTRQTAIQELIIKCHPKLVDDEDWGKYMKQEVFEGLSVENKIPEFGYQSYLIGNSHVLGIERRVISRYDKTRDMFIPIPERIEPEPTIIVLCKAVDYARLILSDDGKSLEEHIESIMDQHPRRKIIYIIQGALELVRKVANRKNQEMRAKIREITNGTNGTSKKSKKKGNNTTNKDSILDELGGLDSSILEQSYIKLEVKYGFRLIHATGVVDAITWVTELLHDIGTDYYKRVKTDAGQGSAIGEEVRVKCGNNMREVLINSLEQVKFVTPSIATNIADVYKNIYKLSVDLSNESTPGAGVNELANLSKGSKAGQRIGPSLAQTLRTLLHSSDPDEFLA